MSKPLISHVLRLVTNVYNHLKRSVTNYFQLCSYKNVFAIILVIVVGFTPIRELNLSGIRKGINKK